MRPAHRCIRVRAYTRSACSPAARPETSASARSTSAFIATAANGASSAGAISSANPSATKRRTVTSMGSSAARFAGEPGARSHQYPRQSSPQLPFTARSNPDSAVRSCASIVAAYSNTFASPSPSAATRSKSRNSGTRKSTPICWLRWSSPSAAAMRPATTGSARSDRPFTTVDGRQPVFIAAARRFRESSPPVRSNTGFRNAAKSARSASTTPSARSSTPRRGPASKPCSSIRHQRSSRGSRPAVMRRIVAAGALRMPAHSVRSPNTEPVARSSRTAVPSSPAPVTAASTIDDVETSVAPPWTVQHTCSPPTRSVTSTASRPSPRAARIAK
ncbi:MAG: hypothetical protein HMLKMBBP_02429 [Planctomycetes bacterium]|nr:hypothetical protein [Planctomycetota bacterium]